MGVESERQRCVTGVRRFRSADADALMAIAEDSPEAASWSHESYAKLAEEKGTLAFVMETNGEISGFLIGRLTGDEAEVLNLAVAAKHRHQKKGTALLEAALEEFAFRGGNSVYLEVRESNTAGIAFYERHGFAKTGLRKGYYRQPDEAAVTMEKKLTGPAG